MQPASALSAPHPVHDRDRAGPDSGLPIAAPRGRPWTHGRLRAVLSCRDGQRGHGGPVDSSHRARTRARQHTVQRHRTRAARASRGRCSCSAFGTSSATVCSRPGPLRPGTASEYYLTPAGRDLERVIDSLGRWAIEWLFDDMEPHEVEPTTLMWWMHRRIAPERFPPRRIVIEWRHTAPAARHDLVRARALRGVGVHPASRLRHRPRRDDGDSRPRGCLPGLPPLAGGRRLGRDRGERSAATGRRSADLVRVEPVGGCHARACAPTGDRVPDMASRPGRSATIA